MNFTREPIIETIITPKEGCKIVVRNSKGVGQEEFFVDALEVVSFGPALFFRSLERPKSFLVPVTDYEILEVRETRMVLKAAPLEKGIKIGGGREAPFKAPKEPIPEKEPHEAPQEEETEETFAEEPSLVGADQRLDKKRDRRRHRRRRGRGGEKESSNEGEERDQDEYSDGSHAYSHEEGEQKSIHTNGSPSEEITPSAAPFATLLPPPTTLISETIARYRGNAEYKKAFFQEPEEDSLEASERPLELFEESKLSIEEREKRLTSLTTDAPAPAVHKVEIERPFFPENYPELPKSLSDLESEEDKDINAP